MAGEEGNWETFYEYDEKGNCIKETTSVPKTANGETRFVPTKEETWEVTYWD